MKNGKINPIGIVLKRYFMGTKEKGTDIYEYHNDTIIRKSKGAFSF